MRTSVTPLKTNKRWLYESKLIQVMGVRLGEVISRGRWSLAMRVKSQLDQWGW